MSYLITTKSPSETKSLARKLAPFLQPGDVISLTGDLGAGKTCFAQGLARGLKIKRHITSPTFVIIREYFGLLPFYHFDLYRFQSPEQLAELGYEEYFFGQGVSVIEWGNKVSQLFPPEYLEIEFKRLGQKTRRLTISGRGRRWQETVRRWLDRASPRA